MVEKTAQIPDSSGLPAMAFSVFALILLAAFFFNRGADVGQLTNLFAHLGGGTVFGFEGLRDSLAGMAAAVVIGFSWFGLGSFVYSFVPGNGAKTSRILDISQKSAIGAAMWSLVWFFLGLIGGYSNAIAIAAALVGLVLAVKSFAGRVRPGQIGSAKYSFFEKTFLGLIAIALILALIASIAPATAKDSLLYHFAVPKDFIAQGGNAFIEGNIASYLALGTEMHSVWAMLLGGIVSSRAAEVAGGFVVFMFFPLLLAAIFGWSREIGLSRPLGLIAVLMVAAVPTAYHVASSGYIDIALALYVTLAVRSLSRWWKDQGVGSLILIAIFLGAALAIKLTALFVFAAFALIVLLRARNVIDGAGKIIGGAFAALILAGAIASPWYLRTWSETGSPVFPFYMSIWKGEATGWDVERSNLFQAMNSQYGGANKTALDYIAAPWNLSVAAQPEQTEYFDGVLGVAFLLGLPVLIIGLWKFEMPIEAKTGTGVAGIIFPFWLFSSQQLRYLLPILPVLALATATAGEVVANAKSSLRRVIQIGFAAACVAGLLVTAAWFGQKSPLRVALGGETRDQYLTRNLDYYPFYETINNETAPDGKIWLINMRRDTYNLDRPVFSDYLFEDWTLREMVWASNSVPELKAKVAAMNIKYVLTRHDFIFDYDRSSLVDDKLPRAENEAKLKIAKDFILDPANTVRADKKFSLIKVF